jgi:hypothetical protein
MMKKNCLRALLLFLSVLAGAQQQEGARARIALFEPAGAKADKTLSAVLTAVADTVELSLIVMDRYEVSRLPAADMKLIRAYCAKNKVDQAITGSASAPKGGGYDFRLVVYDRLKEEVTITCKASSTGTLDIFDAADQLVASLLDGLSGRHLAFGAVIVESDPPGAMIALNGREVGPAPVSLRGLPTGTVRMTAKADLRDDAEALVAIADGETANATLSLKRSTGRLAVTAPPGAVVKARNVEVGEKLIGAAGEQLPTGAYELEAGRPDLPESRVALTVRRGETARWEPWPKGYLQLDSTPQGATILVDGVDRGVTPSLVEVEPSAAHAVELALAHYDSYRVTISVQAATRQAFSGRLAPHPGSIRVEASMPGAMARVDEGELKETPFTVSGVSAGTHVVRVQPLGYERQYGARDDTTVDVKPDQVSTVSVTMVQLTTRLSIIDAPPGSSATIEGEPADPSIFTTGIDVHSGAVKALVSGGEAGQSWNTTLFLSPGQSGVSLTKFTARLVRRTIKVDGTRDDWEGIWPLWSGERADRFTNQPGTRMEKVFLCRDGDRIYGRIDFADGSPSTKLSKDLLPKLVYAMRVYLSTGEFLLMQLGFRASDVERFVGMTNTQGNSGNLTDASLKYSVGPSTLEFSFALQQVKKILGGGPLPTDFTVTATRPNGSWKGPETVGTFEVDYSD